MQSAINSTDIEALWYVIAFHIVLYPKGLNLTSSLLQHTVSVSFAFVIVKSTILNNTI